MNDFKNTQSGCLTVEGSDSGIKDHTLQECNQTEQNDVAFVHTNNTLSDADTADSNMMLFLHQVGVHTAQALPFFFDQYSVGSERSQYIYTAAAFPVLPNVV